MFCHVTHYHTLSTQMGKPSQGEVCMYLSKVFYVFVMVVKCIFLEMLHECQSKPSWSSTTTKLLLLNWNDFASCVGVVWTSVLCAAIHNHSQKLSVLVKILVRLSDDGTVFEQSLHLIQFSTPGSVVPMDHLWNETTFNVIELRDINLWNIKWISFKCSNIKWAVED